MNPNNLKKSLLNYAIEGNLSSNFRRKNPSLNALEEIEAYNQKIKLLKTQREQWKNNLEKLSKQIKEDSKKQRIKHILTKLKKRISTYQIITPINDNDEIPFEIPKSWMWVRLGEICSLYGGFSFKSHHYCEAGIRIIRISDFDEHGIVDKEKIYYKEDCKLENYQIFNQDILIAMTGGTVGKTCILKSISEKLYLNQRVGLIRKKFPLFICYIHSLLLSGHYQESIKNNTNSTNDNISMDFLYNLPIPIPPLNEQRFISSEIEKLLSHAQDFELKAQQLQILENNLTSFIDKSLLNYAIEGNLSSKFRRENPFLNALEEIEAYNQKIKLLKTQREQWKNNLEKLSKQIKEDSKKQRIKHILTKLKKRISTYQIITPINDNDEIPFEIPKSWVWVRLGEICKINPKNNIEDSLDVSFIPMALISDSFKNIFSSETRKWGDIKKNFTHLMNNAIAFAKITPCFQNQKSIILTDLENGYGAGTTELIVLLPHNKRILNYLYFLINSPYFIQGGEKEMTGTAGQQRVPIGFVKNFLIPLPPLEEQKFISSEIEKLLTLCSQIK